MQCPVCGKENPSIATFCGGCGRPLPAQAGPGPYPDTINPEPVWGLTRAEKVAQAEQSGIGMKWYKFLIYFALFASGVINIMGGIFRVTGLENAILNSEFMTQWMSAEAKEASLSAFETLRPLDISCGCVLIIIGIIAIVCRILLARFMKPGVVLLYVLYALAMVETLAYAIISNIMLQQPIGLTLILCIIAVVIYLVIFIPSFVYFNKRKQLFN